MDAELVLFKTGLGTDSIEQFLNTSICSSSLAVGDHSSTERCSVGEDSRIVERLLTSGSVPLPVVLLEQPPEVALPLSSSLSSSLLLSKESKFSSSVKSERSSSVSQRFDKDMSGVILEFIPRSSRLRDLLLPRAILLGRCMFSTEGAAVVL